MCYSMKHEVHVTMAHILEQCSIECTLFPDDHVHSKDFETKKKSKSFLSLPGITQ